MNAYIQLQVKSWMNRETVQRGLEYRGHNVALIEKEDVAKYIDNESIYYGNVGFIRDVVALLGYTPKYYGHVPEELYHWAGRKIEYVPVSSIFKEKERCFIKPVPEKGKQFDGFVYNANQMDSLYVANYFLTGDEIVIKSEVVEFVSEWRCYVCDGEVLDGKHYKGYFEVFPNYEIAKFAAKAWKDAPAAWSCDLGVLKDGRTVIVEVNDTMCLGMYGLDTRKAGLMVERRWEEIHFNKAL